MLAAHASRQTLVTVEEICDESFLDNEMLAAGTIPALYISAITVAPEGAWPVGLGGCYEPDTSHLSDYVSLAADEQGFQQYLHQHVYSATH